MAEQNGAPRAILSVEPNRVDFGMLRKKGLRKGQGKSAVTITNRGNRTLSGEILPQVDWVHIEPQSFRLYPGESSTHQLKMIGLSPTVWTSHRFGSEFIALVTSNGGTDTVSGYYYLEKGEAEKQGLARPIKGRSLGYALSVLGVLCLMIFGLSAFLRQKDFSLREAQKAAVMTSVYETASAEQTAAAPTPTPMFGYGDAASFNATAAAYGESLISNITGAQPTFTPWPAGKYPSPQQFLFNYYTLLNERNFNEAYWLLSENMQRTCCYTGGGTPIENYRALMSGVRSFDLVSAYLQAENVNPAEIRFQLTQYNEDGTMSDSILTAYIIDDEQRNTLLIDEIK